MKKSVILFLLSITINTFSQQEENNIESEKKDTTFWKINAKSGLTFSSVNISDNWASGGNDATSMGLLGFGKASYQREKVEWVSQADLQYGRIWNDINDEIISRKSADKLSLDSKFGYRVNKKWNAFSSLSLLSQFDEGFRDDTVEISNFFAPAYITSSWGVEYKPNDFFYARVSPFSPRITIVNDTSLHKALPENYGVDIGEKIRYEWKAFKITASFDKNLVENISLKADYELFANLDGITADNIDHRLDLLITAKIYKFLNLTITGNLIKDLDQVDVEGGDKKWQSSFQIGLSILLNYQNYKEKKK